MTAFSLISRKKKKKVYRATPMFVPILACVSLSIVLAKYLVYQWTCFKVNSGCTTTTDLALESTTVKMAVSVTASLLDVELRCGVEVAESCSQLVLREQTDRTPCVFKTLSITSGVNSVC